MDQPELFDRSVVAISVHATLDQKYGWCCRVMVRREGGEWGDDAASTYMTSWTKLAANFLCDEIREQLVGEQRP